MRVLAGLLSAALLAQAVDKSKFKTCSQAAFCKRNRFLEKDEMGPGYKILEDTVAIDKAAMKIVAKVQNQKYPAQDPLQATVTFLNDKTVRLQVTEVNPLHPRWEAATPSADVLVPDTINTMQAVKFDVHKDRILASFDDTELQILYDPFSVTARREGQPVLSVNDLGLMNFEPYREKTENQADCDSPVFDGPHDGKYTSDCPSGGCTTFGTLVEALESCRGATDCGAVVLRPENGDLPFELRKGTTLQNSPSGEETYLKKCMKGCKHTAYSPLGNAVAPPKCAQSDCDVHPSLAAAQRLCGALDACAGAAEVSAGGFVLLSHTGKKEHPAITSNVHTKVCTEEEPEKKIVTVEISGHTGIHSFRMGSYKLVQGGPPSDEGRFAYKHESENYFLYYSTDDKAWALGPQPGDSNVWCYVKTEAKSPEKSLEDGGVWSYYDGDSESWIEDSGLRISTKEIEVYGSGEAPPSTKTVGDGEKYPPTEDGMWEESFGGHRDSKPRGPAAVAMDVTFDGSKSVYGLAEHASPLALRNTVKNGPYKDPYRLYNLDVFEYELDVPMALYGAIPLITTHSSRGSAAAFWLNSAETFIDIMDGTRGKVSHWISESGTIDIFLMVGQEPKDISREYAKLTGFQSLPQEFSLAYHQCRWNYKDEADVKSVDEGFDEHDIPYDTIWLDIEHTDGKKYFTWDPSLFPNPKAMQDRLKEKGRKMVTIIDPHIKRDNGYHVHKDAEAQGLYVKDPSGNKPYEGWCWPGSVSYLDFFNPNTLQYWADKFSFDQYVGSTDILYTWNDMNEPSVFNGPEVTMKKDALHWDSVEHRDVHNLYGMQVAKGTWHGQAKRLSKRPFVLTRSFFAGSQRFGAMWTGDNKAEWGHLKESIPMLLSMGVSGFPFAGADVGGFFGDPDAELLLRWYQVGAFYPFFRGHGHIDTKRREPWLFGEPWTTRNRDAIRTRYRILPYVYTLFYEASVEGTPVMRPLYMEFPSDESVREMDDEFLLGNAILVKPITEQGVTTANVYFPDGVWYDFKTLFAFTGPRTALVKAPIEKIPTYVRGGCILPTKERARRNSQLMKNDPYTLYVALDTGFKATGQIYLDDGESLEGPNLLATLSFGPLGNGLSMTSSVASSMHNGNEFKTENVIERIVVVGLKEIPTKVVFDGRSLSVEVEDLNEGLKVLTIRKPNTKVGEDWQIQLI